jgi:hypothetical protein
MPPRPTLVRLACTVFVLVVVSACSGQGEGELCNKKAAGNGNSDCADGLTCTNSSIIVPIPGESYGVCCNATSTNPACLTSETTDANPNPVFDAAADGPAETAADSGAPSTELADASLDGGPEGDGAVEGAPTDDEQDAGDGAMGSDGSADSTVE